MSEKQEIDKISNEERKSVRPFVRSFGLEISFIE